MLLRLTSCGATLPTRPRPTHRSARVRAATRMGAAIAHRGTCVASTSATTPPTRSAAVTIARTASTPTWVAYITATGLKEPTPITAWLDRPRPHPRLHLRRRRRRRHHHHHQPHRRRHHQPRRRRHHHRHHHPRKLPRPTAHDGGTFPRCVSPNVPSNDLSVHCLWMSITLRNLFSS